MIKIENLTKTFHVPQSLDILKDINLEIKRGELVSVVGASGVGKSTLLQLMGGLDVPSSGRVLFNGQNIFSLNEDDLSAFRNRHIGFVFQFHHLLPEFTAIENVMMPGLIRGLPYAEAEKRSMELLSSVGLAERVHHRPGQLSGGEQQRVAIARALVLRPDVVLADEPTGNLDTQTSDDIFDLMRRLNRDYGHTFVLVTHNEKLSGQADRIIRMVDGRLTDSE